jgi:predicted PurR-regulated permease PerM
LTERREGYERRIDERRERVPGPPGPPAGGERRSRAIGWRNRDILRAAALVAGTYITLQLLWFAQSLFFVAFLGILFGVALAGGVDHLTRWRIPRALGAVIIVLLFLGFLTGLGALMAPTLRDQTHQLREDLPAAIDRLENWVAQHEGIIGTLFGDEAEDATGDARQPAPPAAPTPAQPGAPPVSPAAQDEPGAPSLRDRITGELGGVTGYLFPFLSSTVAVIAGILAILFIAIYISIQPDLYRRGLMHLFPHRARRRADEVLRRMAIMLRRWLVTQLVAMLAVGMITTGVLLLLDVPAALALGVLAGLLEFVPIIGPIIASIPAIIMALVDSPQKALIVALAFIGIQQVESQIITPLLMKEGVHLPPVLTLVTQSVMAAVFGFIGLVVAVPLLATAMVPIKMLYVEGVVGDPMELPGDDDAEA